MSNILDTIQAALDAMYEAREHYELSERQMDSLAAVPFDWREQVDEWGRGAGYEDVVAERDQALLDNQQIRQDYAALLEKKWAAEARVRELEAALGAEPEAVAQLAESTVDRIAELEAANTDLGTYVMELEARVEELNHIKARTWTEYEMAEGVWTFTFHIDREDGEDVLAHELAHAVQRFRDPQDEVHSANHAALAAAIERALDEED